MHNYPDWCGELSVCLFTTWKTPFARWSTTKEVTFATDLQNYQLKLQSMSKGLGVLLVEVSGWDWSERKKQPNLIADKSCSTVAQSGSSWSLMLASKVHPVDTHLRSAGTSAGPSLQHSIHTINLLHADLPQVYDQHLKSMHHIHPTLCEEEPHPWQACSSETRKQDQLTAVLVSMSIQQEIGMRN